jgi:DNA-binding XRE family transcriptional regulator
LATCLREQSDKPADSRWQDLAAKVEVSKTTLTNWERDLKEGRDNLKAVELEALSDKFYLATCKHVEFFRDKLSRIQRELETRDLSSTPTEKLFATRAHFY